MPIPATWSLWLANFTAVTPLDSTFTPTIATHPTVGMGPMFGWSCGGSSQASIFSGTGTGSSPYPVAQVLQQGIVGVAYSETISAQGSSPPYTFSVVVGALPGGLTLNSTTGIISGTPTTPGTYTFTIKVTDVAGATGTQAFQINVNTVSNNNFSWSS